MEFLFGVYLFKHDKHECVCRQSLWERKCIHMMIVFHRTTDKPLIKMLSTHFSMEVCPQSFLLTKGLTSACALQVTSSPPVKGALLLAEDVLPLAASSPPLSPTSPSESPTSPPDATPSPPSSTESSALRPRRRGARPRPRPISDYGQLLSRKQSIPEEAAQQRAAAERTRSGDIAGDNGESEVNGCTNGDADSRKLRPVSVIGGVDLLTSNVAEKDDRLPSVSRGVTETVL